MASIETYRKRRQHLLSLMTDGIAILPSGETKQRSYSSTYPFRQDSNFNYLTGHVEPDSVLVLCANNAEFKEVLFVRPKDKMAEMWNGKRLGVEKAQEKLGIEKVFSIDDFWQELPKLMDHHKTVYIDLFYRSQLLNKVLDQISLLNSGRKKTSHSPKGLFHLPHLLGGIRLRKNEEEIIFLKKACHISDKAHRAAMALAGEGKTEMDVQSIMEYIFKKEGASHPAYEPIVASGENANILHYVDNNCPLKKGDLLLIDAGAEYKLYASDITRTFPVSGKFNSVQKDVYNIVLKAQEQVVKSIRPNGSLTENHELAVRILSQGLRDLDVFTESVDEIIEKNLYRKYYPHGTGHWLGLDVHDNIPYICDELNEIRFSPGMVFTVEPGLYFHQDDQKLAPELRGIGIRIEDDILVSEKGFENLTESIPKGVKEIENACSADFRSFLD